ncbi:response regulator transcription factor [Motilibacter deserti]|uniref:Response regulator transcription factor n=1 Tax=Motilibacter deserti TaxID=2714956 RepID=A0ABX0GPZ4_9ACTN|nr:response regulator transcription factor [Motilibacter deserti]NHC12533.1 response regulator transcription factor [Motilibacter deserti]
MISVVVVDGASGGGRAFAGLLASDPLVHVVAVSGDGADAAPLAQLHRPEVVALDVTPPEGGADTVRAVLAAYPETKVLGLAASADAATIVELVGAGATGLLVSGEPVDDVAELVRSVAEGHVVLATARAGAAWQTLLSRPA